MWSDYLQNLRGDEVWRAARYANRRASMTVEALMDRESKQTNTATEKEEMPRRSVTAQIGMRILRNNEG